MVSTVDEGDSPSYQQLKGAQAADYSNDKAENNVSGIETLLENEKPIWDSIESGSIVSGEREDRSFERSFALVCCRHQWETDESESGENGIGKVEALNEWSRFEFGG